MAKALITGGGGFIGGHLASRLADEGYAVDLVDNLSRGVVDADLEALLDRPSTSLLQVDLLGADPLAGLTADYDLIFHLAAIVGVRNVLERPGDVLRQNVELLVNLLDFARRNEGLGRFVFASTSEVYAGTLEASTMAIPTPESTPVTIVDPGDARTAYLLSKIYGEALCLQEASVPVTVVRPHNFYGPRMGLSHVIPELLQRAHSTEDGGTLEVYSVDHRRTFCHIRDAVEMLWRSATSPDCAGEVLNVGREEPEIEIGTLARIVIDTVGHQLEIVPAPATPGSPARRAPDMTKTSRLTGYTAEVSVEEGVRDTYAWYCKNVFSGSGISAL
jgi:UDP-glucuronate decarboxylase